MSRLIFATSNPHKVEEITQFFSDTPYEIQSLLDFPTIPEAPEPYDTFQDNAASKAHFVYPYTGGMVIADDSGLVVDALNGRPGVFSKRYSVEATAQSNNAKLLDEMSQHTARSARFKCVLAIFDGQTTEYIEGACEGSIGTELCGEGGFGYDPLFLPEEFPGRSMADLTMNEKNTISHRGRALQQLKRWLMDDTKV